MKLTRYCLALDLKDDPTLIEEYKRYHAPGAVWPAVVNSIKEAGIENMEIYLIGNRMVMIMEVTDQFDMAAKAKADAGNERVQEWEELMWKFQQALPWAPPGEKWIAMDKIYDLAEQHGD
ncbi:MAG: L-rhamnose mutarotase [Saprospiraceae bacterium]|nr:L-rhamnose mutarotase [Saprospiraceae bacterium]